MEIKATNTRFSFLHGLYWSSFCILYAFLVPLYRHYGFTEATIGFLSMTGSLASMLIQPLWGIVCDRTGRIKGTFIMTVLISIPVAFGLWLGRFGAGFLFPVVFLIASTYMSMGAVLDSWVMKMANSGHKVRYNITRGVGSIAFATTSLLFGRVLDALGMSIIPFAFAGMALILTGVAAFSLAPPVSHRVPPIGEVQADNRPFATMVELLHNRRFVLMIASLMLVFAGNGASIVFMPVRMLELGGANTAVGTAMMVMALSESPAMLLHHRIVKYIRNERLLTISLFFFIVKIIAVALAPSVPFLIAAMSLQFLSFGLYMPSAIQQLNRYVEAHQLTTAMMLFASGTFGLGMMVGSSMGGVLAERIGVQSMLLILSGVTACGFLLHLVTSRERTGHSASTMA